MGLGTDVAGGYSPSMLNAMRSCVVSSCALRMQHLAIHGMQQRNQSTSTASPDAASNGRSGSSSAAGWQPQQPSDHAADDTAPEAGQVATRQASATVLHTQQQSGTVSTSLMGANKAADRAGPAAQADASPSPGNDALRVTSSSADMPSRKSDRQVDIPESNKAGSVERIDDSSEIAVVSTAQRQQFEGCKLDWKAAFWLATQGGAEALGLGAVCGTLEVGKSFDALRVDTRTGAAFDVFAADTPLDAFQKFVNLGDDRNIRIVWVRGQEISKSS